MNSAFHIVTAKQYFIILFVLVAIILAILAPRAAVNVDEQLHYPHAKKVVNWYFTAGKDQSSLHTPVTNLKYYGQSVDNFTALVNRIFHVQNEFLVRHYTGAFFFLLLLLFSALTAREITGKWTMAVFTVLALIFMPRVAGQAFGNLKDIPFAAGYMAGLLMIIRFVRELPRPSWKTAILLGLAIAFTVSVRAGGFILFAYLGLAMLILFIWKPFYFIQIFSTKPVFVKLLGQGSAIIIIGYFAGLLFWPFALQNVFVHPFESLRVMEHYKVSIRQVFEGEMMWSTQLPWYYLPKWILISSPLLILTGFVVFIGFYLREAFRKVEPVRQLFAEGFMLFAFVFPFVYVILIDSNLYSGVRQMLFILPPMTILAVWGLYKLIKLIETKSKPIASVSAVLFVMLLVWPFKHQAETFPVDYVYFNLLAGKNEKAWGNYEYDYYFHALKQPADYVIELVGDEEVIIAMNCNLSNYFDHHPNIHFQYSRYLERSSYDWDYGIFGLNYLHPFLLKNNLWQPAGIVKTFYHRGNPVALLVKRTDKSDFYGISEIKNGNLHPGIELLERAESLEQNNVWLHVNLAQANLATGDIYGFKSWVEKGKKIHPYFEPLYLLEAGYLFDAENYRQAYEILNRLFEINPRYLPAKQLFEDLKRELSEK
jgi:hypothetical protein